MSCTSAVVGVLSWLQLLHSGCEGGAPLPHRCGQAWLVPVYPLFPTNHSTGTACRCEKLGRFGQAAWCDKKCEENNVQATMFQR